MSSTHSRRRRGVSLIEVLVTIFIVGLLVSLLVPATFRSRESSRQVACRSHLRQIGIALQNYESIWQAFPTGLSWRFELLPFLDQQTVYNARRPRNPKVRSIADAFEPYRAVADTRIDVYLCPSDPAAVRIGEPPLGGMTANYAGVYGSAPQASGEDALFTVEAEPYWVRPSQIVDGFSNTAAVSEMLRADGLTHRLRTVWNTPTAYDAPDQLDIFASLCDAVPHNPSALGWKGDSGLKGLPWFWSDRGAGLYNHVLPPNRPSCFNGAHVKSGAHTAAGFHTGGVQLLYIDGHVSTVSEGVDLKAWRDIASRGDTTVTAM